MACPREMQSRETIVSRDHGRSRGYGERFPNNLIRRQRKAGNRHCARTHSMSDTGASVPPPIDSIPSPPTANDAAAAVTPEKEKPPRPAESRSIPFGKRAIAESEVDTAHSRARPARELRPTHVSGSGLCARSCRQLQCAPPSTTEATRRKFWRFLGRQAPDLGPLHDQHQDFIHVITNGRRGAAPYGGAFQAL